MKKGTILGTFMRAWQPTKRADDCRSRSGAPCLTIPPDTPQVVYNWFINIAYSRQVSTRRVNRSAPAIVSAFSGTVFPLRIGQVGHEQQRRKFRSL